MFCSPPSQAQGSPPKFEVEPFWPKPLPKLWVTGEIGGLCVDAQDHVFLLNRRDLTDNEMDAGDQAPPVIEFDPAGNVINSFGEPDVVPSGFHGCTVDRENNVWLTGSDDGIDRVLNCTHTGVAAFIDRRKPKRTNDCIPTGSNARPAIHDRTRRSVTRVSLILGGNDIADYTHDQIVPCSLDSKS